MRLSSTNLLAAAALCASVFGSTGAMAQGTFNPGTGTAANCNPGPSGTTVDTYACTVGTVTANMSTWGFTENTLNGTLKSGFKQGRIGEWDSSGFGAYTGSKEGSSGTSSSYSGQHAFDNLTSGCGTSNPNKSSAAITLSTNNSGCGGSIEALLLNFGSEKVNLTNVGIGWKATDADLSVWAWTGGNDGPDMLTQKASGSTTTSGTTAAALTGWTLVADLNMSTNNTPADPQTATNGTLYSSYFLITTYFGASNSTAYLNAGNDRFKLNSFTVGLCDGQLSGGNGSTCGPSDTPSVPEPASLAMAAIALAGLGFTRRRRVRS